MGVTPRAVDQKIENGRLLDAVLDDGSLDEVKATKLWKRNTAHQMKRGSEGAKDRAGEYNMKLRRMAVDIEIAEINLNKLKDSSVDKEEARKAVRALMRVFRAAMLNFANRYSADIAAEIDADPVVLAGVLEEKMRAALGELSKTRAPFEAGTFGETGSG